MMLINRVGAMPGIQIIPGSSFVANCPGGLNGQFGMQGLVPVTPNIDIGGGFHRSGPAFESVKSKTICGRYWLRFHRSGSAFGSGHRR